MSSLNSCPSNWSRELQHRLVMQYLGSCPGLIEPESAFEQKPQVIHLHIQVSSDTLDSFKLLIRIK